MFTKSLKSHQNLLSWDTISLLSHHFRTTNWLQNKFCGSSATVNRKTVKENFTYDRNKDIYFLGMFSSLEKSTAIHEIDQGFVTSALRFADFTNKWPLIIQIVKFSLKHILRAQIERQKITKQHETNSFIRSSCTFRNPKILLVLFVLK